MPPSPTFPYGGGTLRKRFPPNDDGKEVLDMTTPGMPSQTEYSSGDELPLVYDQNGGGLDVTVWRCMQCGETTDMTINQFAHFPPCSRCNGQRWAFVSARPSY